MRSPLAAIPPLPNAWPFRPRLQQPRPVLQPSMALPVFGEGWSLFAQPGLIFGEATELGTTFGRGGITRLGEVMLRPYRRGGLVRHLNERIYASPARFAQEFLAHQALWLAGFPTVEPLGYAWRRKRWGVEGVFLTRHAACEPWPRQWVCDQETVQALKEQILALCAWGLFAPDLNATNVMIGETGHVLLLDWDRASWGGTGLFERYRARLVRSLQKLSAPQELIDELVRWEAP